MVSKAGSGLRTSNEYRFRFRKFELRHPRRCVFTLRPQMRPNVLNGQRELRGQSKCDDDVILPASISRRSVHSRLLLPRWNCSASEPMRSDQSMPAIDVRTASNRSRLGNNIL